MMSTGEKVNVLMLFPSFSADCDYFVLDGAKLNLRGVDEKDMGLWLFKASHFSTIKKLPACAFEILQLAERKAASFSQCLGTAHVQFDLKLLTSCLKIWNMGHWPTPLLDMSSPELALDSEYNTANVKDMLAPCYSFGEPAKQERTEFDSQHYLELIKIIWELQSFELQMKLYMFLRLRHVSEPGDVKEEDAGEGHIMEGSQEEHPEEHVHSKVKGQPAAEDGSDVILPGMSSCKRSEEVSTAPPELRSCESIAIGVVDLDPMMVDGGEALEGEPPGAGAGHTDNKASQVANSDAALSRKRTGIAAAIAESELKPEAIPESDAEPESQWSPEVQFPVCSDSDGLSKPVAESIDEGSAMKEFYNVVWLMRGKCAWETKDNGLVVCMMINDVMKDCPEKFSLHTAWNIWGWKTNSNQKYWCCFNCDKRFPDQTSHMLHMESEHYLGLS